MAIKKRHTIVHYIFTILWVFLHGVVSVIIWFLIGIIGFFIFQTKKSPFDIVVGLPLLLVALGFIVQSLWSTLLAIFSPSFNEGSCSLCHPQMEED